MKSPKNQEKIRLLFQEFEKYDRVHDKFLLDFENDIYNFIVDQAFYEHLYDGFSDDLQTFSRSLINAAYEVIEKDHSYPAYRMAMELENMDHLLLRYPRPKEHPAFTAGFSTMTKAKMPHYFPALYELSAAGFRLLERCVNYRIHSFLAYFYQKI